MNVDWAEVFWCAWCCTVAVVVVGFIVWVSVDFHQFNEEYQKASNEQAYTVEIVKSDGSILECVAPVVVE